MACERGVEFFKYNLSKRNQSRLLVAKKKDSKPTKTLQKEEKKPTHQQPDLNIFESFGSQNLPQRNQSQKIKNIKLKCLESTKFEDFFNLWQPKPVQKESKPPNQ